MGFRRGFTIKAPDAAAKGAFRPIRLASCAWHRATFSMTNEKPAKTKNFFVLSIKIARQSPVLALPENP